MKSGCIKYLAQRRDKLFEQQGTLEDWRQLHILVVSTMQTLFIQILRGTWNTELLTKRLRDVLSKATEVAHCLFLLIEDLAYTKAEADRLADMLAQYTGEGSAGQIHITMAVISSKEQCSKTLKTIEADFRVGLQALDRYAHEAEPMKRERRLLENAQMEMKGNMKFLKHLDGEVAAAKDLPFFSIGSSFYSWRQSLPP